MVHALVELLAFVRLSVFAALQTGSIHCLHSFSSPAHPAASAKRWRCGTTKLAGGWRWLRVAVS
jgi:hypothetical protein